MQLTLFSDATDPASKPEVRHTPKTPLAPAERAGAVGPSNLELTLRGHIGVPVAADEQWMWRCECVNYSRGMCVFTNRVCPLTSHSAACESHRLPASEREILAILEERAR